LRARPRLLTCADVLDAFDAKMQRDPTRTVWNDTDHSWYGRRGPHHEQLSGSTIRYCGAPGTSISAFTTRRCCVRSVACARGLTSAPA
jgi:hypothetical protein